MDLAFGRSFFAGLSALALCAGAATATVINFDNLGGNALVTNQYPGVSFSSDAGEGLYTSGGTPVSYPYFLCTAPINGSIDCVHDVFIDFASPVSNISIWAIEGNEYGTVATFFLYNGATLLGTHNLIGLASVPASFGYGNQFVDLSAFSNVTRVEIRGPGGSGPIDDSYGGVGIGWDDLSYTVPTPGALGLFGLAGVSASRRRGLRS